MHPGDTCHKATYTATYTDTVQTYEQRHRSIAQSRPTVIWVGSRVDSFWRGNELADREGPRSFL
ncbi:hypothetical protein KB1_16150 [Cutibacterium modestum]|uniref:Uncharacterized protein n=1 Tax=Cutibacterium modestum TaxID=2559073 RepID=A0AAD1NW21_9ACTN|nr:hypothetical protein KB1_16150 [Cutibacterium modestum]